jgi:hypothetical protein
MREYEPAHREKFPELHEEQGEVETRSLLKRLAEQVHIGGMDLSRKAGVWFLGGVVLLGSYIEIARESRDGANARAVAERLDSPERKTPVSIEQIREYVRTDNGERAFLCSGSDLSQCVQVTETENNGFAVGGQALQNVAEENRWQQPVLMHTHPLSIYEQAGIRNARTNQYPEGEVYMAMPPSVPDLSLVFGTQEAFKSQRKTLRSAVAGTDGVWYFHVEENSEWARMSETVLAVQARMHQVIQAASPAERKQFMELVGELENIYDFTAKVSAAASRNSLAKRIEKIMDDGAQRLESYDAAVQRLDTLAVKIASLPAAAPKEQRDAAVKEYIKFCRPFGITVSFQEYTQQ